MGSHVFISYSRRDTAYVDALAVNLESTGIPVWVDRERIASGDKWARLIRDQVDSSAAVVVVMTPDAEDSEWVGIEVERARSKDIPIMPLLLEGDVFFALGTLHYHDVRGGLDPPPAFISRLRELVAAVPVGVGGRAARSVVPPAEGAALVDPVAAANRRWRFLVGGLFIMLLVAGSTISVWGFNKDVTGAAIFQTTVPVIGQTTMMPSPSPVGSTPQGTPITLSAALRAFGQRWLNAGGTCVDARDLGAAESVRCSVPTTGHSGLLSVSVLMARYANSAGRDQAYRTRFAAISCLSEVGRVRSSAVDSAPVRNLPGSSGSRSGCYAESGTGSGANAVYTIYWEDESAPLSGQLDVTWAGGRSGDWSVARAIWQQYA